MTDEALQQLAEEVLRGGGGLAAGTLAEAYLAERQKTAALAAQLEAVRADHVAQMKGAMATWERIYGEDQKDHAAELAAVQAERDKLLADWREQDLALQRIDSECGLDADVSCAADVVAHVVMALAEARQSPSPPGGAS